jgi:NAD(P)-dependent dehydrogenase (short-subunit alcohol dehydrogenase family)
VNGSDTREPELLGQTVIVIGGSAGIGLETARRARQEGATMILTARGADRLRRVGSELGARVEAFDVTPRLWSGHGASSLSAIRQPAPIVDRRSRSSSSKPARRCIPSGLDDRVRTLLAWRGVMM